MFLWNSWVTPTLPPLILYLSSGTYVFTLSSLHLNDALFSSEVIEKFRAIIAEKLVSTLSEIKSGKVFYGALWILGEYVESVPDI